jgi:hypothetical protein
MLHPTILVGYNIGYDSSEFGRDLMLLILDVAYIPCVVCYIRVVGQKMFRTELKKIGRS